MSTQVVVQFGTPRTIVALTRQRPPIPDNATEPLGPGESDVETPGTVLGAAKEPDTAVGVASDERNEDNTGLTPLKRVNGIHLDRRGVDTGRGKCVLYFVFLCGVRGNDTYLDGIDTVIDELAHEMSDEPCFSGIGSRVVRDSLRPPDIVTDDGRVIVEGVDSPPAFEQVVVKTSIREASDVTVHPILCVQRDAHALVDAVIGIEMLEQGESGAGRERDLGWFLGSTVGW